MDIHLTFVSKWTFGCQCPPWAIGLSLYYSYFYTFHIITPLIFLVILCQTPNSFEQQGKGYKCLCQFALQ